MHSEHHVQVTSRRASYRLWRRTALGSLLALLLLASACSGGSETSSSTTVASSDSEAASESTSASSDATTESSDAGDAEVSETETDASDTDTESNTSAEAEDDAADAGSAAETEAADTAGEVAGDAEDATRTVTNHIGSFEVPANPERIVVMSPVVDLPAALDVGASVIGTLSLSGDKPSTSMVTDEEWAELQVLGSAVDSSVEAIAAANPDLILVAVSSEAHFDLYSQVASAVPIVLTNRWQDDALQVADAVNKRDEMQALIDDYTTRADEIAERIDTELGDPSAVAIRIRPGSLRVHTSVHFAGNVFEDVGLRVPEMWQREPLDDPSENIGQRLERISPEQIGLLADADHLFVLVQGTSVQTDAEVKAAYEEIVNGSLWATLPAVQNGNVHFVEGYWLAGTLRAAEAAIDDIERYMLDGEESAPSVADQ